ncbi:MAG: hypothetical protein AVDCRST_MAG43-1516 [uncultured Thermomicrobiales bacterium]|uniref:Uncharacterized protein n=1 Tax=uncultured Thermomicrobiales bacterium TaxID=1645740 RepID=A0A6J4US79_9BACT|nr:MAG: hypothetical protein AVDCRST_MAG43-1516 [uncultured Thermomicrobiales bacterium]
MTTLACQRGHLFVRMAHTTQLDGDPTIPVTYLDFCWLPWANSSSSTS